MMNIVMLLLDAIRAENLGCYGYERPTTPNIDKLASDALMFENCFAQSNRTEPSLVTVMSGKNPINHGVVSHGTRHTKENARTLNEGGTNLLPEILQSEGYETMAIDWLGRWHRRGYDYYGVSQERWKSLRWKLSNLMKKISGPLWEVALKIHAKSIGFAEHWPKGDRVTDSAIKSIKQSKKDFFLFVHYWEAHAPYSPPEEHKKPFEREGGPTIGELRKKYEKGEINFCDAIPPNLDEESTLEEVRSAYDGCVHWVDSQVGRIVDYLEKEKMLKDTLIIVFADHGEALGEHGHYFQHGGLYDHTIHVPLIYSHPNFKGRKINELVQLTDLTPTILEILDINKPPFLDGERIPGGSRKYTYTEHNASKGRAIRSKEWKYIQGTDGEKEELYNLRKDPKEEDNLIEEKYEKAQKLKEILKNKVKVSRSKHEKSKIRSKTKKLNL